MNSYDQLLLNGSYKTCWWYEEVFIRIWELSSYVDYSQGHAPNDYPAKVGFSEEDLWSIVWMSGRQAPVPLKVATSSPITRFQLSIQSLTDPERAFPE